MAYNGTIQLISGITPKNNGDFPLVNAKDVYVDDNTRLNTAIGKVEDTATGDLCNISILTQAEYQELINSGTVNNLTIYFVQG